jgi:hypothetical protein
MFKVPSWVEQRITLPASAQQLSPGKRTRSYIKRCTEGGYEYHYTQSQEAFDRFYHELYVPYVSTRFRDRVLVTPYEDLNWLFRRGGLFLVTLNQALVAGRVCYVRDETFFAADAGISLAGPNYWKQGGLASLDFYTMQWACERGLNIFNFGGTRSWYSDGVFNYKSLWGARASRRSKIYSSWTLMAQELKQPLRDRINEIGFISEVGDAFYGVHLTDEPGTSGREDIEAKLPRMRKLGLDGVLVVAPRSQALIRD